MEILPVLLQFLLVMDYGIIFGYINKELRGIIGFENGTTFAIWPLDGGDRGRRHPHVLYRTKWTNDAKCGAQTQILTRFLPLNVDKKVNLN